MNRRYFLRRTAMAFPASLALGNFWLESSQLVTPAFAAGDSGDQKTSLEQRVADLLCRLSTTSSRKMWLLRPSACF